MKKLLKSLLGVFCVCVLLVGLTECGNAENEEENNDINNQGEPNAESDPEDVVDEVKLYSDDTKIVYNYSNIYYIVYYHDGTNITGLEFVYNYPDRETAAIALTTLKTTYEDSANENVESITQEGKQITIKFNEEEYKDDTLEEIKSTYSFLEEVQNNNK